MVTIPLQDTECSRPKDPVIALVIVDKLHQHVAKGDDDVGW